MFLTLKSFENTNDPQEEEVTNVASNRTRNPSDGKLGPNWEGLYRVRSVTETSAYHLEAMDSTPLPWPWNINNLQKHLH